MTVSGNLGFSDTTAHTDSNSVTGSQFANQQQQTQQQTGAANTQQTSSSVNLDPSLQALVSSSASSLAGNISGANLDALKSEAVREFNLSTGQQIQTLAQKYGSEDNSFVQLLQNQGQQQLQTQLASLGTNFALQSSSSLAALVNADKFATTSNTGSSSTDTLSNLLANLTSTGNQVSNTNTAVNSNSFNISGGVGASY